MYEDSGTEGGPILCQRVFHQLFNPPPSKVVFQFTSSTILRITTVFFLDFFWGVDLISVADTLLLGLISEEVEIFVSASLTMKLREYTRNTPIRRNPVSKF